MKSSFNPLHWYLLPLCVIPMLTTLSGCSYSYGYSGSRTYAYGGYSGETYYKRNSKEYPSYYRSRAKREALSHYSDHYRPAYLSGNYRSRSHVRYTSYWFNRNRFKFPNSHRGGYFATYHGGFSGSYRGGSSSVYRGGFSGSHRIGHFYSNRFHGMYHTGSHRIGLRGR